MKISWKGLTPEETSETLQLHKLKSTPFSTILVMTPRTPAGRALTVRSLATSRRAACSFPGTTISIENCSGKTSKRTDDPNGLWLHGSKARRVLHSSIHRTDYERDRKSNRKLGAFGETGVG